MKIGIGAWSMVAISGAMTVGGALLTIIIAVFFGNDTLDAYRSGAETLRPLAPWHVLVLEHRDLALFLASSAFIGGMGLILVINSLFFKRPR